MLISIIEKKLYIYLFIFMYVGTNTVLLIAWNIHYMYVVLTLFLTNYCRTRNLLHVESK